jgi:hypothetical protein
MNVKHMEEHNNRFVFISATMIKELYDLYRWGELHELYKMTIPDSYIGHKDFLVKGIVKEFYALNIKDVAEKWVQEDILDCYKEPCMCIKCNPEQNPAKNDFRVHLVRVTAKTVGVVQNACIRKGITFRNHTSTDRLSEDEIKEFFKETLTQHIVLGVKGFFRRANLIPNRWKLRIGATHELYTKIVDNNVQIQGLTGRMTGYWYNDIEGGHKTGPHRTSIKAIEEYEKTYMDPFGINSYQTAGFKKKNGTVSAEPTMLSSMHITNLKASDCPIVGHDTDPTSVPIVLNVSMEDFNTISKTGRMWNITSIQDVIKKYSNDTYNIIRNMEKNQIVQPDTDNSYNKLINEFVKASENNIRYSWMTGDKKSIDTYQIYLDKRSYRIIVSIYYGSKTLSRIECTQSI